MDAKDKAIVIAVAEAWNKGQTHSWRSLAAEVDMSYSGLRYRVGTLPGWAGAFRPQPLFDSGWLCGGYPEARKSLTPGPKFGGLLRCRKTGAVTLLAKIGD